MKKLTFEDSPTKRVVTARVPHGVNPQIVITIYPGGVIGLRELRRRKEYTLDTASLYVSAVRREISLKNKRG